MTKKNLVAIDTSCSRLSVAVRKAGGPVKQTVVEGYYQHAENLLPLMDRLMTEAGFTLQETDEILINRGPGSFTGLRVGFATLKGLRLNSKITCRGAVSTDLIAQNTPAEAGARLAVAIDARRDKIFLRSYENRGSVWHPVNDIALVSLVEAVEMLPAGAVISGDAVKRYGCEFSAASKGFRLQEEKFWYPEAAALIRLSDEQSSGFLLELTKPEELIPFYLRLSDPEEKKSSHVFSC